MSNKFNYESLALHLYDAPPEIKKAPWWMIHRAIDFYSVQHTRRGEKQDKLMAEKLVRLLGQLTLEPVQPTPPAEGVPVAEGTGKQ